jgi:hypothetical protein
MQSKISVRDDPMEDTPVFQNGFWFEGRDSGAEPDVAVYVQ